MLRLDTTPAEICDLALSGCNFWIMIRNRLASMARDDELNMAQSLEKRERRWTDDQYRTLAASSVEDELESPLKWSALSESQRKMSSGMSVNHVRVIMEAYGYSADEIKVVVLVPQKSTNTDCEGQGLQLNETSTMFRISSLPNKFARLQRLVPMNLNPHSSTSMKLYRHWLERCEFDHKCGIRDSPESMPSLILDVAESDGVKLIQVPATMKEPYVALSYCWGFDRQRAMLTRSNHPVFLAGIDPEALDLTISDSVTVTRELGFRYLWIDALCIVQDDDELKAQELEKMGDIYHNAAFTIVASGAKDVTEGFLHRRTSTLDRFGVVPGYPQPVFKFHEEGAQGSVMLVPYKRYDEEPWYQRAWTMQEMLLSKRCLRFGLNQTAWACHRRKGQGDDCDGWLQQGNFHFSFGVWSYLPSVTDDRVTSEELLIDWSDIISQYSSRQLRFRRDRLPAISAIARAASSILGNYICGLWTSHLPICLAWYRAPGNVSGLKGEPSWSWASHEGKTELVFLGEDHKIPNQDFMLLSHNVDLVTPGDPFGEVRRAELHVRGLLLPIQGVIRNELGYQLVKVADQLVEVSCIFDYQDIPGQQPDTRYALSLLVLVDFSDDWDDDWEGVEGIIVLEEAGNRYSRVGWFELSHISPGTSSNEDKESDTSEDEVSDTLEDEESDTLEDEGIDTLEDEENDTSEDGSDMAEDEESYMADDEESDTAEDESDTAEDESDTAKDESDMAEYESVRAEYESIVKKDELGRRLRQLGREIQAIREFVLI